MLPPDSRADAQRARREACADERRRVKEEAAAIKEEALRERLRNMPLDEWDFMVAGVAHEGRGDIVWSLLTTDNAPATAYLARDARNPHSPNAVEVRIFDGRCVGYALPSRATGYWRKQGEERTGGFWFPSAALRPLERETPEGAQGGRRELIRNFQVARDRLERISTLNRELLKRGKLFEGG